VSLPSFVSLRTSSLTSGILSGEPVRREEGMFAKHALFLPFGLLKVPSSIEELKTYGH